MRALKYALITVALLLGASFLYAGMGVDIPMVEFDHVTRYGVPLGLGLFAAALVLAQFWQDGPTTSVKG